VNGGGGFQAARRVLPGQQHLAVVAVLDDPGVLGVLHHGSHVVALRAEFLDHQADLLGHRGGGGRHAKSLNNGRTLLSNRFFARVPDGRRPTPRAAATEAAPGFTGGFCRLSSDGERPCRPTVPLMYRPLPLDAFALDQPVPVNIWDPKGVLLLRKGERIVSEQHRGHLMLHGPVVLASDWQAVNYGYTSTLDRMVRSNQSLMSIAQVSALATAAPAQAREGELSAPEAW